MYTFDPFLTAVGCEMLIIFDWWLAASSRASRIAKGAREGPLRSPSIFSVIALCVIMVCAVTVVAPLVAD